MTTMLLLGAGLAGFHLRSTAEAAGVEVVGAARSKGDAELQLDLLEPETIESAIRRTRPDWIANLAGETSVAASWADPTRFRAVNETGTRNLLEAAAAAAEGATVLCVSSGEVYGLVPEAEQPITEDRPPSPANPYAESKLGLETICAEFARQRGLAVVLARPFAHTGPRQRDMFAPSAFARRIAEAELAGATRVEMRVGDISVWRDFSDVRDVARAYLLMLQKALPGPLNVCSGEALAIGSLLDLLAQGTELEIEIRPDRERIRPVEIPLLLGSNQALRSATGWSPSIPLERTMRDLLDWWRAELRR